jgi:hypothetical protein
MKKLNLNKILYFSKCTALIILTLLQTACDVGTFSVEGKVNATTAPNKISLTTAASGNAQSASRGTTLPTAFSATITNSNGSPVSGISVLWTVIAGGGILSSTTTSTNANGIVTSILTLGQNPGINTVTATIQGTTDSVTFNSTATTIALTSNIWNLISANSSSYAYGGSIDFAGPGNACELSPTSQTDKDNTLTGFGGGSLAGAATWDSNNSYLRLGTGPANLELNSNWTPAWDSVVGYWKMNEATWSGTAGEVIDSSNHSNNGTAVNSANTSPTAIFGRAGSFDGSSKAVLISDSSTLSVTSKLTMSAWFYANNSTHNGGIIGKWTTGAGIDNSYTLIVGQDTGNDKFAFYLEQSNNAKVGVLPTTTFTAGKWYHIVCVADGTNLRMYVNGIDTGSSTAYDGTIKVTTKPLVIGRLRSDDSIYSFNGNIDDVALWNTALSPSAIYSIYQHQISAHAGTFTSRVMDALSVSSNWTTLSWIPTLPFLKELTNTNETKANYSSTLNSAGASADSSLATGLVGLWHFNETALATAPGGTDFVDSSGNNKHATLVTPAKLDLGISGVLSKGIHVNANTPIINLPSGTFPVGAAPRSFAMWVKVDTSVNQSVFSYGNYGSFSLFEILAYGGTLALHCYGPCDTIGSPTVPLTVGTWQHFAVTYDGTVARIYSNGQYFGQKTLALNTGTNMSVFGHGYYANVNNSLDELAAWSRTLSASEILQVYRRGANRLKYQVRSCSTSNCGEDLTGLNWKGPDGTNQSYFSELHNTSTQSVNPSGTVNSALPSITFSNFTPPQSVANRYFQYRAILESDDTSTNCTYDNGSGPVSTWCSPELKSVTIGPNHYDLSAPSVITKTGLNFYSLSGAIETVGSGGCSSGVVYNLGYGATYDTATWYYYTAGNWLTSGGTSATSNTATSLNASSAAALTAFGTQIGTGTVYLKAFLQSSGESPCQLNSFQLDGLN